MPVIDPTTGLQKLNPAEASNYLANNPDLIARMMNPKKESSQFMSNIICSSRIF